MGKSFRFDPWDENGDDERLTKFDKKQLKQERKDRHKRLNMLEEHEQTDDE